ncbi:probable protein phosphatase 2C 35 isoform X1 [Aristolochia californica]|uniref:probable protein phosphatase 2C 35 isoform X1 n=2 Tax=Aristolochia californica TaxID=171875 RepID=UPI0035DFE5D7
MGCVNAKCCAHYESSSTDVDVRNTGDTSIYNPLNVGVHHNLRHALTESSIGCEIVPSHNYQLQYAFLTQRGYYPDSPDRENQDSFCIRTQLQGNPNLHFFGVFDGHGQFGGHCANFVRERLVELLANDPTLLDDPVKAYTSAFLSVNEELHDSEIDDTMSGTTAITVLVIGDTLYVANVGDSRATLGVRRGNSGVVAEDLSSDQTPFRRDEYERVKLCGARVLSIDQVEGIKDPNIQAWGSEESDGGDPPRLWVQNGMYPGTAFTRSVGDSTAEKIGVIAEPEILKLQVTQDDLFFVVASDGVFEFLNSQAVVNMVVKFMDPRDACAAIAAESYKIWLDHENRTDDITIIIVHIKDLPKNANNAATNGRRVHTKPALLVSERTTSNRLFAPKSEINLDAQSTSLNLSMECSSACVVPSPTRPKVLESVC